MDAIFDSKSQEENIPMADTLIDDEMFDEEDLDRSGFDQQISDDSPPDEE